VLKILILQREAFVESFINLHQLTGIPAGHELEQHTIKLLTPELKSSRQLHSTAV
jgi:hypothetical protein